MYNNICACFHRYLSRGQGSAPSLVWSLQSCELETSAEGGENSLRRSSGPCSLPSKTLQIADVYVKSIGSCLTPPTLTMVCSCLLNASSPLTSLMPLITPLSASKPYSAHVPTIQHTFRTTGSLFILSILFCTVYTPPACRCLYCVYLLYLFMPHQHSTSRYPIFLYLMFILACKYI